MTEKESFSRLLVDYAVDASSYVVSVCVRRECRFDRCFVEYKSRWEVGIKAYVGQRKTTVDLLLGRYMVQMNRFFDIAGAVGRGGLDGESGGR
jgi:hypothetical protein